MRRTISIALAAMAAGTLVFFAEALFSPVTLAVPAFARKTGLSCSACHEVWPRLNDFGQLFRDRGYRLKRDRDAPVEQDPSYWPIAMRTAAGYQWLRNTLVATGDGTTTTTTSTGTFGFTGLDVFAVGTLGDNLSFLITYTPGLASAGFQLASTAASSDLESAWLGFNDILGSSYLNLRVGKHALDLPIDEHRQITLTQGYNVYHFHPQGSAATWAPGDNQSGLEIYGHSEQSRVRYSLSLVNERDAAVFSKQIVSNPVLWGHVTGTQYLDSPALAAVRAGLFGSVGWHPATALTVASGTPPATTTAVVQGTGSNMRQFVRYGAEAHLQFISVVNPLTVSGVVFGGSEDAALIVPATAGAPTKAARFLGGFVEGVYTVNPRLSVIGRWERINNTQSGDPTLLRGSGNLTAYTGAVRHTFELTSRTEAALQIELSRSTVQSPAGSNPEAYTGFLVFDFTM